MRWRGWPKRATPRPATTSCARRSTCAAWRAAVVQASALRGIAGRRMRSSCWPSRRRCTTSARSASPITSCSSRAGSTPAEWEIMKTHAALGAEAIERAEARRAAADRVPGRGQADRPPPPRTLGRQRLPRRPGRRRDPAAGASDGAGRRVRRADLAARLQAGPALHPRARHHRRQRGSHFDPDVVDVFIADFDTFRAIADRHADSAEDLAAKRARLRAQPEAGADPKPTPAMP